MAGSRGSETFVSRTSSEPLLPGSSLISRWLHLIPGPQSTCLSAVFGTFGYSLPLEAFCSSGFRSSTLPYLASSWAPFVVPPFLPQSLNIRVPQDSVIGFIFHLVPPHSCLISSCPEMCPNICLLPRISPQLKIPTLNFLLYTSILRFS